MARTTALGVILAAAVICSLAVIRIQVIQSPIAPYEMDYLTTAEPAYHLTPVKRVVRAFAARTAAPLSVIDQRRLVAGLRLLALAALAGLALRRLGTLTGGVALAIFLTLPPTFPYLVRADPWMDSVSFAVIGLYLLSLEKFSSLACAAGLMAALSLDSKITAGLTLVPAAAMALWGRPRKDLGWFLVGGLAGFGLAQPGWVMHPGRIFEHVGYWKSFNAALDPLPVTATASALGAAVPLTLFILAISGFVGQRRDARVIGLAVLAAVPIIFFTLYRTVNLDGIRHLYLVLPFLSALAAAGFERCNLALRSCAVLVWLAELLWRDFPVF